VARTKCVMMLVVEYDDEKTDDESVASALDGVMKFGLRELQQDMNHDYGIVVVDMTKGFYPSTQNPDNPQTPDCWIDLEDDASTIVGQPKPLRMQLYEDSYGGSVAVLNNAGDHMAQVSLDYFNNKLQAIIYADSEQPIAQHVIVEDVEVARAQASAES